MVHYTLKDILTSSSSDEPHFEVIFKSYNNTYRFQRTIDDVERCPKGKLYAAEKEKYLLCLSID